MRVFLYKKSTPLSKNTQKKPVGRKLSFRQIRKNPLTLLGGGTSLSVEGQNLGDLDQDACLRMSIQVLDLVVRSGWIAEQSKLGPSCHWASPIKLEDVADHRQVWPFTTQGSHELKKSPLVVRTQAVDHPIRNKTYEFQAGLGRIVQMIQGDVLLGVAEHAWDPPVEKGTAGLRSAVVGQIHRQLAQLADHRVRVGVGDDEGIVCSQEQSMKQFHGPRAETRARETVVVLVQKTCQQVLLRARIHATTRLFQDHGCDGLDPQIRINGGWRHRQAVHHPRVLVRLSQDPGFKLSVHLHDLSKGPSSECGQII